LDHAPAGSLQRPLRGGLKPTGGLQIVGEHPKNSMSRAIS